MPNLQLPSRQRLARVLARTITIALWAAALAYTAGRLARTGYEWARPHIAQALHALAIALDGGLAYPDQPEPDPDPDSDPEFMAFRAALEGAAPLTQARYERLRVLTDGVVLAAEPLGEVRRMPAGESLVSFPPGLVTVFDRATGQRVDMATTEPA